MPADPAGRGVLRHRHDDHDHAEGHDHGHDHEHEHPVGPSPSVPPRGGFSRGAGGGKVLYFDAHSGVAGDMIIAALLDLGVPRQVLDDAVAALALPGVSIDAQKVWVGAIYATRFTVNVEGVQHERRYSEIVELLRQANLDEDVRVRAQSVFLRLARAEGRVHGVPLEDVHFHEVGAVDAIVDIIGAAALLSYLGARLLCSPLPLGHGWVNTRHGVLPVPAPATLLCLEGMATIDGGVEGELTTPTGAAIVAALGVSAEAWPSARPLAVGWGAGHRELRDRPNALRVVLCEPSAPTDVAATHEVLSCNVDDMTGEELGHAIARLIDQGALDAWASPIVMKKGRPAWCVSALGTRADAARLALLLLEHSTSLGVRRTPVSRIELGRRIVHVSTRYGQVPVKVAEMSGRERGKPEFDVCAQLSARHGVAVRDVVEAALEALRSELGRAGE